MEISKLIDQESQREEIKRLLESKSQTTTFEAFEPFQFYLIRRLKIEGEDLVFDSVAYLLGAEKVYALDTRTADVREGSFSWDSFRHNLEKLYDFNHSLIVTLSEEIERLEESLFERKIPAYFMDVWFDLKKDISKIENYYQRALMVFREFFKTNQKLHHFNEGDFQDIEEKIVMSSNFLQNLKSRLDSLHHYHKSIRDEKLNKSLYLLTFISGVFLPLNLIVGFFGMNTNGMFFDKVPQGTENVLWILVSIFTLAFLGLPALRVLDQLIFRQLLGRYRFYKGISARIDQLESSFKLKD